MANRRMFSLDVVDTDKFLDLPISSQALYFHLGMRADDDGFISSPKRVITIIGAKLDDLKLLIAKGFIIAFDDGIIVIRHWKQNNYIQNDRHKSTIYQNQLETLTINNGAYDVDTQCIQNVSKAYPQYSIDISADRNPVSSVRNSVNDRRNSQSREENKNNIRDTVSPTEAVGHIIAEWNSLSRFGIKEIAKVTIFTIA